MAKVLHPQHLIFSLGMGGAICEEQSVIYSHHSIVLQLIVTVWWNVTADWNETTKTPVAHNLINASIT
jgi:hypothetical protein